MQSADVWPRGVEQPGRHLPAIKPAGTWRVGTINMRERNPAMGSVWVDVADTLQRLDLDLLVLCSTGLTKGSLRQLEELAQALSVTVYHSAMKGQVGYGAVVLAKYATALVATQVHCST